MISNRPVTDTKPLTLVITYYLLEYILYSNKQPYRHQYFYTNLKSHTCSGFYSGWKNNRCEYNDS